MSPEPSQQGPTDQAMPPTPSFRGFPTSCLPAFLFNLWLPLPSSPSPPFRDPLFTGCPDVRSCRLPARLWPAPMFQHRRRPPPALQASQPERTIPLSVSPVLLEAAGRRRRPRGVSLQRSSFPTCLSVGVGKGSSSEVPPRQVSSPIFTSTTRQRTPVEALGHTVPVSPGERSVQPLRARVRRLPSG